MEWDDLSGKDVYRRHGMRVTSWRWQACLLQSGAKECRHHNDPLRHSRDDPAHQFNVNVIPMWCGQRSSGLLPLSKAEMAAPGDGDTRVQAYNTDVPDDEFGQPIADPCTCRVWRARTNYLAA